MTKKDFFRIILKLFGLYVFIDVLFDFIPNYWGMVQMGGTSRLVGVFFIGLIVLAFLLTLILEPDLYISLFRLDKGYDDDRIEMGAMTGLQILQVSILIIGGVLFVDKFPVLFSLLLQDIGRRASGSGAPPTSIYGESFTWHVFTMVVQLILSILLIRYYDSIARRLYGHRSSEED